MMISTNHGLLCVLVFFRKQLANASSSVSSQLYSLYQIFRSHVIQFLYFLFCFHSFFAAGRRALYPLIVADLYSLSDSFFSLSCLLPSFADVLLPIQTLSSYFMFTPTPDCLFYFLLSARSLVRSFVRFFLFLFYSRRVVSVYDRIQSHTHTHTKRGMVYYLQIMACTKDKSANQISNARSFFPFCLFFISRKRNKSSRDRSRVCVVCVFVSF